MTVNCFTCLGLITTTHKLVARTDCQPGQTVSQDSLNRRCILECLLYSLLAL